MISRILCFICISGVVTTFRIGTPSNRIVDHFIYTPRNVYEMKNGKQDVQWEFLVIGKRVPWNEAQAICPIYGHLNPASEEEEMGYDAPPGLLTRGKEADTGSTLAVFHKETTEWLAKMVSESNYRYDGLWIGGQRKDSVSNWSWIDTGNKWDMLIPDFFTRRGRPNWYVADDRRSEKNCLMFDRLGHDVPVFVPEDCRQRKPFICMRAVEGKKNSKEKIFEGSNIFVDGQRYTLYHVIDNEDEEKFRTEGVRKVSGGGITWRDAKLQCKKRGKQLAMIFTNEAATIIANAMLRSRPSMESVWLGSRSVDGSDWIWVSSGFTLPSKKSNITLYPPWANGHPVSSPKTDEFDQRERCLILDRHLCAEHTTPAFLDLDCEKKRPFVCQDAIRAMIKDNEREILLGDKRLVFSLIKMTWNQGRTYCQNRSGCVASILDAKTLSAVLDKMAELELDHIWVGGHTIMSEKGWKWVDENDETLSKSGIDLGSSWCFDKNDSSWPYADREICLNLDREDHGTPLFYGLPCNTTNQYVLCNLSTHKNIQSALAEVNETTVEGSMDTQQQATDLAGRIRKLAKDEQTGLLFVMDDSVLNAWFAEEMKLAATIIRRYFPLSQNHPMGMIIFSQKSKVALALNQTDICKILISLSKDMLVNRTDRISKDFEGISGKTDLINAALASVDTVHASNMKRVITVFVTDGEHVTEANDKANLRTAVEKLQNLRHNGHEAFAVVVSQGQKHAANYNVIEELFPTSLKGERNLYFVEGYEGLAEMNSALNKTEWKEDYAAQCGEIQWIVPKDNETLAHL